MSAVRSWVGSLVITVNSRPWCTTGSPPANSMIADLASVPVTPAGKATMVGSVDSGQSIVRAGHRVLTWRAGNPVLRGPNSALSAIAPLRPGQDYECRHFEQPTRLQELSCLRQPRFDPPSPRENSAAEPWRSAGKAAAEHHHRPRRPDSARARCLGADETAAEGHQRFRRQDRAAASSRPACRGRRWNRRRSDRPSPLSGKLRTAHRPRLSEPRVVDELFDDPRRPRLPS